MKLNIHLAFGGQCEAAFQFYEQCLDGKIITMLTYGDSPMSEQVPTEWREKIVHATLRVGDSVLVGADVLPRSSMLNRRVSMYCWVRMTPRRQNEFFRGYRKTGTVHMPLQKTFWVVRFGVLVDRFGISREVNCEQAG